MLPALVVRWLLEEMTMTEPVKIPNSVYRNIAAITQVQDGDKWPLVEKYSIEYVEKPGRVIRGRFVGGEFIVRHRGEVVATLTQGEARDKA